MSTSKFWITIKNEYPNIHEIAMGYLLCFSTTHICETAFSAMTVLKTKQRIRLQLSVSVWLSFQFIPKLISWRKENSNRNLSGQTETIKNSVVIK
jgi:hypothetical protein